MFLDQSILHHIKWIKKAEMAASSSSGAVGHQQTSFSDVRGRPLERVPTSGGGATGAGPSTSSSVAFRSRLEDYNTSDAGI